jgi:predicted acyl esterase
MTHWPYAKWLAFQDGFPRQWANLEAEHPDALAGSSGLHMNWETVDPEKWVPDGYVIIRVDSRGAGRSPGYLDIFSPRETRDYFECIEWAAAQPWSNGKVCLLGVSYYAIHQWQVAALRPPHLAAICPWEGGSDFYRDFTRHGGILNVFVRQWYPPQVSGVQHGVGERGPRHRVTGGLAGAARLQIASSTADADLFLTLRVLDPNGRDVTFVSGQDPHGCVGFGWLRAPHRKTDPERSMPWRPWHTHDEHQPLTPGEPVTVDVEIWPTSVVIPAGYRLEVSVRGRDFELPGDGPWPAAFGVTMRGNGTFVHDDPADRPPAVFGGITTLLSGGDTPSFLLLPVIPPGTA